MASVTLESHDALEMLERVVKDMAKESPISQNEKKWARWRFVIEHTQAYHVTFDLDELATILMRSKG
jgi:hypothetical protein